jgi:hypothetical protein
MQPKQETALQRQAVTRHPSYGPAHGYITYNARELQYGVLAFIFREQKRVFQLSY